MQSVLEHSLWFVKVGGDATDGIFAESFEEEFILDLVSLVEVHGKVTRKIKLIVE
jgi:hypothetical protein